MASSTNSIELAIHVPSPSLSHHNPLRFLSSDSREEKPRTCGREWVLRALDVRSILFVHNRHSLHPRRTPRHHQDLPEPRVELPSAGKTNVSARSQRVLGYAASSRYVPIRRCRAPYAPFAAALAAPSRSKAPRSFSAGTRFLRASFFATEDLFFLT